jgi:hypothetical protein
VDRRFVWIDGAPHSKGAGGDKAVARPIHRIAPEIAGDGQRGWCSRW